MLEAFRNSREVMSYIKENPDMEEADPRAIREFNDSSYLVKLHTAYQVETEGNQRIDVRALGAVLNILAVFSYALFDQPQRIKRLEQGLTELNEMAERTRSL